MAVRRSGATVVTGVSDPGTGRAVLAQALDLAARMGGDLIIAHVEEIPVAAGGMLPASGMAGPPVAPIPTPEAVEVAADRTAEEDWVHSLRAEVAAELGLEHVACTHRHGVGDPGRVLADLAHEADAYCVVVGSRGEGIWAALGRMFRPSVSRSALRDQRVPVLVVPSNFEVHDAAQPGSAEPVERAGHG